MSGGGTNSATCARQAAAWRKPAAEGIAIFAARFDHGAAWGCGWLVPFSCSSRASADCLTVALSHWLADAHAGHLHQTDFWMLPPGTEARRRERDASTSSS